MESFANNRCANECFWAGFLLSDLLGIYRTCCHLCWRECFASWKKYQGPEVLQVHTGVQQQRRKCLKQVQGEKYTTSWRAMGRMCSGTCLNKGDAPERLSYIHGEAESGVECDALRRRAEQALFLRLQASFQGPAVPEDQISKDTCSGDLKITPTKYSHVRQWLVVQELTLQKGLRKSLLWTCSQDQDRVCSMEKRVSTLRSRLNALYQANICESREHVSWPIQKQLPVETSAPATYKTQASSRLVKKKTSILKKPTSSSRSSISSVIDKRAPPSK